MTALANWENLLLGALALLLIFWMRPGIKNAIAQSRNATPDWPAFLVPMAVVIVFVLFLIAMV